MNTIIQQSASHRNQCIAAKSLYVTVGIIVVLELRARFYEQNPPLVTWEHSIIFATTFLLIFTYVWLTGKRNIQIKISTTDLEISHDEEISRFTWQEVKKWQQPVFIVRPYWLFELKNTQRIKISTRNFSKKQLKQIREAFTVISNRTAA